MNKRRPLIVAGIVFTLVAIVHLLRLMSGWQIVAAGQDISMTASVIGLIVATLLALWMFAAAFTK